MSRPNRRDPDPAWATDQDRHDWETRDTDEGWFIVHLHKSDMEQLAQGIVSPAVQARAKRLIQ